MSLTLITAPTSEPLTVADARNHLRLDDGVDDQYVNGLVVVARQMIESDTRRAIMAQTWDMDIDHGWPYRNGTIRIDMPLNPVSSVTSITYVDGSSPNPTLSSSLYTAVTRRNGSFIVPSYGSTMPDVRNVPAAITVRFVAGYASGEVPEPLVHAMKLMISHLYEHRGDESAKTIPRDVEALISPYRPAKLSTGMGYRGYS